MPGLACSQERDEDTWDGVLVFPNFGNLGRRALAGVVLDFQPPESAANGKYYDKADVYNETETGTKLLPF